MDDLPSSSVQQNADAFKVAANEQFKNKHYEAAIDLYSKAIDLNPKDPIYYGNRSFANLKIELFGSALADATSAIEIDPKYIKGYYRRAASNMALAKFKLALKDFEAVARICPNDTDAVSKFRQCKQIVHKVQFEKAIAVDSVEKSKAECINLDAMSIDDSYDGPSIPESGIDVNFMKELLAIFKKQEKLHKKYAYQILLDIRTYLMQQPSLVDITVPQGKKFTVCGDIHGQFYDLLNIFELNGLPSEENPYLFNGDFVDRGSYSVECIFTLFGFKLLYPNHMFLSRGNHESQVMNQMYGFEGEVKAKYSQDMAELFTEIYNWLPLCHLINNKILVMHGGLFNEDNVTLDDLRKIDRNRQPPDSGPMCDLLWSDPQPEKGRCPSKRGVGCQFGPDVTEKFLKQTGLDYVIRSHEVRPEGFEINHGGKCITVFSAPNYCDMMGNKGAFITLTGSDDKSEMKPKFTQYEAVPHPNVKPMAYANSFMSLMM